MAKLGVFPCYENQFGVKIGGGNSFSTIADMETFGVSFNNGVQEWTPFETEGWVRRLMTSKGLTLSVKGKRNVGDEGNDFIASLYNKNGRDVEVDFQWTFPDGSAVLLKGAVINVTNVGAGESTGVAPLEFEVMSNGKPEFTEATA